MAEYGSKYRDLPHTDASVEGLPATTDRGAPDQAQILDDVRLGELPGEYDAVVAN